ncbi:aminotransferase class V-fold PLP-dependent enzyme [Phyllobacterium sp. UNC302MFCol5.2]|uniref:pyridoxal-phosphate-dependent aminotransferase family protein n=1 Tax=Phyllobacterium sp. UNC302MFCol5.2 TaxID=1449065 RepID=UPI000A928F6A|nr:aminotransferase class V-fold PLP-dependent enzyme [Phyllobacterium sp. UNC302MFCol5.2]
MSGMANTETYYPGWQLLQIPGPSNVPPAVLHAIARPTIDHRGLAFAAFARNLLEDLRPVFGTREDIIVFPSSGTGAWEAALVNTMSPGERVLMAETGHFSTLWFEMAERLGLGAELLHGDWRHAADPEAISKRLVRDTTQEIKAVCVVHNETSTGATSDIVAVRRAIDATGHPALLMVDTISSLGSVPYEHDRWGVDVTVSGSQKGLMLPPGLGFNVAGPKAWQAAATAKMPRAYFDWAAMATATASGQFPYTPATNLLFGLRTALDLLSLEGMDKVFRRHARHGRATRAAVTGWGLEVLCVEEDHQSNVLTAVVMPDGASADAFRSYMVERFNLPLGNGLAKLRDRVFRIGHLGDFNDLMLIATLGALQLGLEGFGIPVKASGLEAAMAILREP